MVLDVDYSEEQNLIPSCSGCPTFVLRYRTDAFVVPSSLQMTLSVQGEESWYTVTVIFESRIQKREN